MKKKYYVNVHYDAVLTAEVIAESEKEALELAERITETMYLEDAHLVGVNSCLTWIDEMP